MASGRFWRTAAFALVVCSCPILAHTQRKNVPPAENVAIEAPSDAQTFQLGTSSALVTHQQVSAETIQEPIDYDKIEEDVEAVLQEKRVPSQWSAFLFGAFTAMSVVQAALEISWKSQRLCTTFSICVLSLLLIAMTVFQIREVMHVYAYFSFLLGCLAVISFASITCVYHHFAYEDEEERGRIVKNQIFTLWLLLFLVQLWFGVLEDERHIKRLRRTETRAIEAERRAIEAEAWAKATNREQKSQLTRIRGLENMMDHHVDKFKTVEDRQAYHAYKIEKLEREQHDDDDHDEDDKKGDKDQAGKDKPEKKEGSYRSRVHRIVDLILDDILKGFV